MMVSYLVVLVTRFQDEKFKKNQQGYVVLCTHIVGKMIYNFCLAHQIRDDYICIKFTNSSIIRYIVLGSWIPIEKGNIIITFL